MKKLFAFLFLLMILLSCEVKTNQNPNTLQRTMGSPITIDKTSTKVPYYVDIFTYHTDGMKYVVFATTTGGVFVVNVTKDLNDIK